MSLIFFPPPIQKINSEIARHAGVDLYVLRLDLMHPWVNGNKWFKLKYNLLEAKEKHFTTLLTFGGAYSNHIYATAAAGNLFGFRTIGVIRGEETLPLNPTLSFAVQQGMQLVYVNREMYRQRNTPALQEYLQQRFGEVFIIPEGGSNLNGVRGCTEIVGNTIPTPGYAYAFDSYMRSLRYSYHTGWYRAFVASKTKSDRFSRSKKWGISRTRNRKFIDKLPRL